MEKRFFLKALGVLCAWGITLCGYSQETDTLSLTLSKAREMALEYNYKLQNSEKEVQLAKHKLREVVGIGLPQVNGSAEYAYSIDLATTLLPGEMVGKPGEKVEVQFGSPYNSQWGISVNQLLFSGSYLVGVQTSKIYRRLSEQSLKLNQVEVVESLQQTYFNILVAQESLDILQKNVDNLKNILFETRELFKEGFVEETDIDQLEYNLNRISTSMRSLQRQKEIAEQLLKFQMGINLNTPFTLTEDFSKIIEQVGVSLLLSQKYDPSRDIQFQLMDTQAALQKKNLQNEKAGYFPELSAFYNYGQNAMGKEANLLANSQEWYPSQTVGVKLKLPIFSGMQRHHKVAQAKIELSKAETSLQETHEALMLEANKARIHLNTSWETYQDASKNMRISEKVYNITLEKYKEGMVTSLDLTQAHNQFLEAENSYVSASSDLLMAKNAMDRIFTNFNL